MGRPRHNYLAGLRLAALAAVHQDRVHWGRSGRGLTYRVWHCGDRDHDAPDCTYRTMTPQVEWLCAEGLARRSEGYGLSRGLVEMTVAGEQELGRLAGPALRYLAGWRLAPR